MIISCPVSLLGFARLGASLSCLSKRPQIHILACQLVLGPLPPRSSLSNPRRLAGRIPPFPFLPHEITCRVLFPADPGTDLETLLDVTPSLSRFSSLLKEQGLSPKSTRSHWTFDNGKGGDTEGGASGETGSSDVRPRLRAESLTHRDGSIGQKEEEESGNIPAREDGGGRVHRHDFGRAEPSFTIFAPTNDALERLETERPWLFQTSSPSLSQEGNGGETMGSESAENVGGGRDEAERAGDKGPGGLSSLGVGRNPLREFLAYHIVPGAPQYSRHVLRCWTRSRRCSASVGHCFTPNCVCV